MVATNRVVQQHQQRLLCAGESVVEMAEVNAEVRIEYVCGVVCVLLSVANFS